MDGFGVAVTGSTCFNLMQMKPEDRKAFLEMTFDPINGYGFSYVRISIGCSDFSLSEYTCCDKEGIENFALTDEETKYVIPILKEILAVNPSLKIMGTPWTPPKWMKVKDLESLEKFDSWTSGQLNPKYYQDYGTYFAKWVQAFAQNGIKIFSVTPQNEPLNRGNSASCYMSWEEERDFVKNGLGPAFKKAGLDVKIYAFDHNYNYDNIPSQKSYPTNIYADEELPNILTAQPTTTTAATRRSLYPCITPLRAWISCSPRLQSAHGTTDATSTPVFSTTWSRWLSALSTAGARA